MGMNGSGKPLVVEEVEDMPLVKMRRSPSSIQINIPQTPLQGNRSYSTGSMDTAPPPPVKRLDEKDREAIYNTLRKQGEIHQKLTAIWKRLDADSGILV